MTFNRHGNPSAAYRASLRAIRPEDYKELELVVIEALLNKEVDITLVLPYTCKLPKGFPQGVRIGEDGPVNYYRAKAVKLLKWLNEKGYSIVTPELIRVQGGMFTKLEKEVDV